MVHAVGLHGAFLNELVRVGESPVVLGEVVSLHTIPGNVSVIMRMMMMHWPSFIDSRLLPVASGCIVSVFVLL